MFQLDLGDKSASQPDVLQVVVRPGDSVIVANAANGDTLNYFSSLDGATADGPDGTIATGASQTFTVPPGVWLTSSSRSSLQLDGGLYGP